MNRSYKKRLNELRLSGEVKTGRQLAEAIRLPAEDQLFPGQGRDEETPFGRCYIREISFPLDHRHGNGTIAGILSCSGPELSLPARDSSLEAFNPRQSLFLDIETTGLAGGTGTWAFLIGLGRLDGNAFLLQQYFLRRPAEERALLNHFAAVANSFPTLVTFNGKLFDLPLIQTRQLLAGFRHTEPSIHLDLLQCARTLWKKRLASRSLRSLEESILGLQRSDDIPGAEIPAVYFDYLRRGKTERLKKVFEHNVLDILSMVTLLARISALACGENVEHPAESLALGRLCLERGLTSEGIGYLRETWENNIGPLGLEAALELSFYYKRRGRWPEATAIWQNTVAEKSANPVAHIELAKYYEHRCGNYDRAIELTLEALGLVGTGFPAAAGKDLSLPSLRHRLQRLKRKRASKNSRISSTAAEIKDASAVKKHSPPGQLPVKPAGR